jgi:hypothetical protein
MAFDYTLAAIVAATTSEFDPEQTSPTRSHVGCSEQPS